MNKLILFLSMILVVAGCTKDSSQSTPQVTPDKAALTQVTLTQALEARRHHHRPLPPPVVKPPVNPPPVTPPPPPVTPPPVTPPPVVPPVTTVAPIYPAAGAYITSSAVDLTGVSNQVFSGLLVTGGSLPCIKLTNSHDCTITLCNLQNSSTDAVYLVNCYNITIVNNNISNVASGVYAEDCPNGNNIVVNYNRFHNMQGPLPRGQYVQFNNVNGSGLSISYNRGDNILGSSHPEDNINLFQSNGTAASPIQIVGNWIKGGGPSGSGGGIMLGDYGGSYQYAANNILDNPGQYGMAIAGGDHNSIVNNQIYAAQQSFTNVGIYVWGQGGATITNATVSGNSVNYTNSAGDLNPDWLAPGESTPTGWSSNAWNSSITSSILPTSY